VEILQLIGEIFGYAAFYLAILAGVCLIPLGLPGQFLIVIACLIFILVAGSQTLTWWMFGIILFLAVFAEVLEALAGGLGAGKAKGSKWSFFGALAGGLAGAILGSLVFPIIGSVLGVLAGTFLGAYAVEYWRTKATHGSIEVAKGALAGRILGTVIKVVIALAMIVLITFSLLVGTS